MLDGDYNVSSELGFSKDTIKKEIIGMHNANDGSLIYKR